MDTKKLETILQNRNRAEFDKASKTEDNKQGGFSKEPLEELTFKEPANTSAPVQKSTTDHRKHFGLGEEDTVPNIQFKFKSKRIFHLPYASHPYIDYDPENGIKLETMQKIVTIQGQRLERLLDYISNQTLDWVMESKTGKDNNNTEIFIEKIEVRDR